jgi:hypothetical protein
MNVFSPYVLLKDTPLIIHLKENNFRKNLRLLVLQFFPVVFIPAAIFLVLLSGTGIQNGLNIFMIVASIIATASILRRKVVSEVLITKTSIDVTYTYFFGSFTRSFPVSFIDHITCKRHMRGGKAPVYVFSAVIKGGSKIEPLLESRALYTNGEKRTIIKNKLETVTGLKVILARTRISRNNVDETI